MYRKKYKIELDRARYEAYNHIVGKPRKEAQPMKYILTINEDFDEVLSAEELGKLSKRLLSEGKTLVLDEVVHESMYFRVIDA